MAYFSYFIFSEIGFGKLISIIYSFGYYYYYNIYYISALNYPTFFLYIFLIPYYLAISFNALPYILYINWALIGLGHISTSTINLIVFIAHLFFKSNNSGPNLINFHFIYTFYFILFR